MAGASLMAGSRSGSRSIMRLLEELLMLESDYCSKHKEKVLEMFSEQYRAGGGELDLSSGASVGDGDKEGLLDRVVRWYVTRQQKKGA